MIHNHSAASVAQVICPNLYGVVESGPTSIPGIPISVFLLVGSKNVALDLNLSLPTR